MPLATTTLIVMIAAALPQASATASKPPGRYTGNLND